MGTGVNNYNYPHAHNFTHCFSHVEELEKAINNENILRYIKYKRLSWLGHVERMTNERVAKTIYKWKLYATRLKGRPRVRWEDDVRNNLRKMGVTNWKQRTQERKQ